MGPGDEVGAPGASAAGEPHSARSASDKAGATDKHHDTGQTAEPTTRSPSGRHHLPHIGTYRYRDSVDEYRASADEDDARAALAQPRGPGMWLPLLIFVALLVAGGLVGRYLLPSAPTANAGAPPVPSSGAAAGADPTVAPSLPSLPALPTPPARPADALHGWAERVAAAIDVPVVAIEAYGYAQLRLQHDDPGCHLGWTTLAGIGEVASQHGQAAGASMQANGRPTPTAYGPLLDGKDGRDLVRDTDAGAFDGNAEFDRAMGPLMLMPAVWRAFGADADGDRILDPFDIDDAALAVGRMLCDGDGDLSQLSGWNAALQRWHPDKAYASSVFEVADRYGQRTRSIG